MSQISGTKFPEPPPLPAPCPLSDNTMDIKQNLKLSYELLYYFTTILSIADPFWVFKATK
jgi:hypothetical protein